MLLQALAWLSSPPSPLDKPAAHSYLQHLACTGADETIGPVDEAARYRHHVYTEILETEKAYVRDMQVMVRVFQRPLQE